MKSQREQTLELFAHVTGLRGVRRVIQRGRDTTTARFTIEFDDDRQVRVGTIDVITSQAKLNNVLIVAIDQPLRGMALKDWRNAINALLIHCKDVEEIDGENYEDTVRDWLAAYTSRATKDRDGAILSSLPFIEDGDLYLTAAKFRVYIHQEYVDNPKLSELREALGDLGFERVTLNYKKRDGARSSTSYYHGPLAVIDGPGQ